MRVYKSLAEEYPSLANEWHPTKNGDLSPYDVSSKSGRKVWWIGACGHEWMAAVSHRSDGQNCPFCSNHRLLVGYNDLNTKFPDIAKEWHPTKNGDLLPTDVFPMSNRKVWWLGKCGHEWQVAISCRTKGNNGCPVCSGYLIQPGINDLKTVNPILAAEWDYKKNFKLSPDSVSPNTHRKVWWVCPKCGNQWKADIHHRSAGAGCPSCATKQASQTRINNAISSGESLLFLKPTLALEWHYQKNGSLLPSEVLSNSNRKVWWRCKKGHEWQAVIASRNAGHGCPYCDFERKTSFPEQALLFYLSAVFETKSRCKQYGKEVDIFLPEIKTGIEYDGSYYHQTSASIEKDLRKTKTLNEHGLRLIRLIEGKSNSINIDTDIVTYKHDAKYTELPWAIKMIAQLLGITDEFDIDLERDRIHIFEQYIQLEKENSLETQFPGIAKEWHPTKNGRLTPSQVSFGSQKRVWWLGACGHEWQSTISSRTNSHSGCPICSGNRIVPGINDLCTKNPFLATEWDYERNVDILPTSVSAFSHKKVWWICSQCGNKWQAIIKNRNYGAQCPECSKSKRKAHSGHDAP